MGQYLAIGLATTVGVKKPEVAKAKLTIDHVQEQMRHKLHYVPDIYHLREDDEWYDFHLDDDIFHTQLLPLLKTLYPLLYPNAVYYDDILQKLATISPSEWLQLAKNKSEEAFQFDQYGESDYLEANHSNIHVHYESLLLSMEGKMMMETYGRQFAFLKYTMMRTFQQFSLAGALRIYITG